jgi:hypothetical protein
LEEEQPMNDRRAIYQKLYFLGAALTISLLAPNALAEPAGGLSLGATVYVSIYSNVYVGPKATPLHLAGVLSIRNTDPKHPIIITSVDYYDSTGKVIRSYIQKPFELGRLASTRYYLKEYDKEGGSGANFIVKWRSREMVNKPIIEAIMTGSGRGQGISFYLAV